MIGNGTFWAIADAAQDIDATDHARRLCSNVLVRAKDIGIGGDVVRGFLVLKCPRILRPIDLFEICDARVPRVPRTGGTGDAADNRRGDGEDSR